MNNEIFVIDYSSNDDKEFVVYEVQPFSLSNNHDYCENQSSVRRRFENSLKDKYPGIVDFLIESPLGDNKILQRIALSQPICENYNPDFIIHNNTNKRYLSESEINRIENFYEKNNGYVITKFNEAEGRGNKFYRGKSIDDLIIDIKKLVRNSIPFILESERMLFSEKRKIKYDVHGGVYYRDIVIISDKNIISFTVYKMILNKNISVNCHADSKYYNEKGYLGNGISIEKILEKEESKRQKNQERYAYKQFFLEQVYNAISSKISLEYIDSEFFITNDGLECLTRDIDLTNHIHHDYRINSYKKNRNYTNKVINSKYLRDITLYYSNKVKNRFLWVAGKRAQGILLPDKLAFCITKISRDRFDMNLSPNSFRNQLAIYIRTKSRKGILGTGEIKKSRGRDIDIENLYRYPKIYLPPIRNITTYRSNSFSLNQEQKILHNDIIHRQYSSFHNIK